MCELKHKLVLVSPSLSEKIIVECSPVKAQALYHGVVHGSLSILQSPVRMTLIIGESYTLIDSWMPCVELLEGI